MSYLTDTLAAIEPGLRADPLFQRAEAAFRENPSTETFEAVCQHVAYAVHPDEADAYRGWLSGCRDVPVAAEFLYAALAERLMNSTGFLNRLVESDARIRHWLGNRTILKRAGVDRRWKP